MYLRKISVILFLSTFLFSSVRANDCCPTPCCAEWKVYGDWIYWNTRRCQLDYATPFDSIATTAIGNVSSVCPGYESGFRVGISRECGNTFYDLFYTYYRPDASDTTTNVDGNLAGSRIVENFTALIPGTIALAKGKWNLDYDEVNLLMGYKLCSRPCVESYVVGGFKYASIDQDFESFYSETADITTNVDKVKESIDLNAYGVNFGLKGKYTFCKCFNLFANASHDVLLGDFNRKFTYDTSIDGGTTFTQSVNLKDESWCMLGVYNLAFGLGYDMSFKGCWCADLSFSVGYEFHQWVNTLDFLDYQNESQEITFDRHLQSLGFDGLFVQLSVGF